MEKKTECEIVQDLLFGYIDNVLNPESRKLVEQHIAECEQCKEKYLDMLKDTKDESFQKKEIDYLKKLKRKTRIKIILTVFVIIFSIFFIIYIRKFIIFNNLKYKASNSLKSQNMYIQASSYIGNGKTSVTRTYIKDGKYKKVGQIYTEDGIENVSEEYASEESDESIYFYGNGTYCIFKDLSGGDMFTDINFKGIPYLMKDDRLIIKFVIPFIYKIYRSSNDIMLNQSCYVLKPWYDEDGSYELWIDIESGLPLKEFSKNSRASAFDYEIIPENLDTNNIDEINSIANKRIYKEIYDDTTYYFYEFDTVTDEDVALPDLSEYEMSSQGTVYFGE